MSTAGALPAPENTVCQDRPPSAVRCSAPLGCAAHATCFDAATMSAERGEAVLSVCQLCPLSAERRIVVGAVARFGAHRIHTVWPLGARSRITVPLGQG